MQGGKHNVIVFSSHHFHLSGHHNVHLCPHFTLNRKDTDFIMYNLVLKFILHTYYINITMYISILTPPCLQSTLTSRCISLSSFLPDYKNIILTIYILVLLHQLQKNTDITMHMLPVYPENKVHYHHNVHLYPHFSLNVKYSLQLYTQLCII